MQGLFEQATLHQKSLIIGHTGHLWVLMGHVDHVGNMYLYI